MHTKGMEGLMENPPNCKTPRRTKVDNLPVAFVNPPDLGVAKVGWVLSIPHACEDQVWALVALVHLSKNLCLMLISVYYKVDKTHLKPMQGTPVSIFWRAWVMFSIWSSKKMGSTTSPHSSVSILYGTLPKGQRDSVAFRKLFCADPDM